MSKQGSNSEHFAHENDALKQDIWTFTGDYTGFSNSQKLQLLLHWIITGPKNALDTSSKKLQEIDKSVNIVGQIITNLVKTT